MQRHDRLAAELKFWLPAVEVRSPAILPGGSRSSALASIAEASGVNGSGLAGAIIRFFGMLWPSPRRVRVRVWVEWAAGPERSTPSRGSRSALTTREPGRASAPRPWPRAVSTPPLVWRLATSPGASSPETPRHRPGPSARPTAVIWRPCCSLGRCASIQNPRREVRDARCTKIGLLRDVADGSQCAGVARYELAHLHDLTGDHVKALKLHANNQEQYPRFYRGRYRLAMSLEMIASSDPCTRMK